MVNIYKCIFGFISAYNSVSLQIITNFGAMYSIPKQYSMVSKCMHCIVGCMFRDSLKFEIVPKS